MACELTSYTLSNCHLLFYSGTKLLYDINLEDAIAVVSGNGVLLKDGETCINISAKDLETFVTTQDDFIMYIQTQRLACQCPCEETPTVIQNLNKSQVTGVVTAGNIMNILGNYLVSLVVWNTGTDFCYAGIAKIPPNGMPYTIVTPPFFDQQTNIMWYGENTVISADIGGGELQYSAEYAYD